MNATACSTMLVGAVVLAWVPSSVAAQESYSPHVDAWYPSRVFWGDTHVHTAISGDAFALGTRLTPEDAYRFAKGEALRATGGREVRLRRPLDFLLVADHAENMGVLPRLAAGDDSVPSTEVSRRWAEVIADLMPLSDILNTATVEDFERGNRSLGAAKGAWQADYGIAESFRRSVWRAVVEAAERHNDPGAFTTFAGFEWSARTPTMVHRNVLFADGPDKTGRVLPFSRFDSDDVEDLWAYLDEYRDRLGGDAIAIPHNGNLSGGEMFKLADYDGEPLTRGYAQTRSYWEPIVEVTQIKGDGETHPLVSPSDEFADFETWPGGPAPARADAAKGAAKSTEKLPPTSVGWAARSYARSALKLGLDRAAVLGVNPFKFGMIASTDSHTALATADEANFWGKMGLNEPSPYRAASQWIYGAAGYAAVWATDNTREALFAAMRRRETYATTGPRMTVRLFGGWDYAADDASRPDLAAIGYAKGVPMGGDLPAAPTGGDVGTARPSFLIHAVKDPDGANLDRVQVVKGWRDIEGGLHEMVLDVALSDGRKPVAGGKVTPVGNTVNVADATYTNTIGDTDLTAVWVDPTFSRDEAAFYYVRVLEIPTPRWTAYDAAFFGLDDLPEKVPMVVQERAYTSPIWYTPAVVDSHGPGE